MSTVSNRLHKFDTFIQMGKDVPVKSHVDFGSIMPVFGRTQYFFGEVVLTCQNGAKVILLPLLSFNTCNFSTSKLSLHLESNMEVELIDESNRAGALLL